MFVSAPDWDTLLDVFTRDPLPDIVIPDVETDSTYGPYRSTPSLRAPPTVDLEAIVRCPTCAVEMERIEFAAISRVIIDVCPDHGVWLDAGELERIMESFHPHPLPDPIVPRRVVGSPIFSGPARTLAEAAAEPIVPSTPEDATHVAPDENWKQSMLSTRPMPAKYSAYDAHEPWAQRLGRTLSGLVQWIRGR
jgi:hypothetical protein